MSDKDDDNTNPQWNTGNLSDPADVKKQNVIVIPDQGPLTDDDGGRSPRPTGDPEPNQDGDVEHNQTNGPTNQNEIEKGDESIENEKPKTETESENNKEGTRVLEHEENEDYNSVPPNSAMSEKVQGPESTARSFEGDLNGLKDGTEQNSIPKEEDLGDLDHTMTQSIVLDEEEVEELERVMSGRESQGEGHQTQGQGCAMCELCQAEGQQNRVAIKVDYNMVFRGGATRSGQDGRSHDLNGSLSRGKLNTPTSEYTEVSEHRGGQILEGKDTIFQQALSLMSERCLSRPSSKGSLVKAHNGRESAANRRKDGALMGRKTGAHGVGHPHYFYINQSKPTPMEPLKAWKGYTGNVYFEPISIQTSKAIEQAPPKSPDIGKCSPELQQILLRSRRSPSLHNTSVISGTTNSQYRVKSGDSIKSRRAISRNGNNPSPGGQSTKSFQSKTSGTTRQSVILDKRSVLSRSNENIEEDIMWLAGQESTGSLCVLESQSASSNKQMSLQQSPQQTPHSPQTSLNRDRIRKGSMVRHIQTRIIKRAKPMLSVSGDKFTEIPKPSPLIRAQTQYSHSNQRALITPDGSYHGFSESYEKLPPLEQLRASLKQLDNSPSKESLIQVISTEDRIRLEDSQDYKKQPLLKYSSELRFRGVPRQAPLHRRQIVK